MTVSTEMRGARLQSSPKRDGHVNCATNGLRFNRFGRYTGWPAGMSPRPFRQAIGLPGWIHKPPTR